VSSAEVTVTIRNESGLHVRAAAMVVRTAATFRSTVTRGGQSAQADSVLELLTLAAAQGAQLQLSAEGPDAELAVAALRDLIERGFAEHDPQ
jgi:phosphocarrier protein HPr